MKKRKKMKPVTRYAVVHDSWRSIGIVHLEESPEEALAGRGGVLANPAWGLVRVRITEAPKKRAKRRSRKP